ncbi:hypothetical protein L6452_10617 [Arctium lappa]|uniref:Uncharacterized protein n=1 Tax=Arctium lappa TaxID=4217 RepID=A0ACB9DMV5_ARCLA|nr:hypothetical protein L6452_10617 [Arctium lappa]
MGFKCCSTFGADAISRCVASSRDRPTTSIVVVNWYKGTPSPCTNNDMIKLCYSPYHAHLKKEASIVIFNQNLRPEKLTEIANPSLYSHLFNAIPKILGFA